MRDLSTPKIRAILSIIAMIILINWYSARIEIIVVSVPAPANIGKANGTTDAVAVSAASSLNIRTPNNISNAINAIKILPATENELMSTPIK